MAAEVVTAGIDNLILMWRRDGRVSGERENSARIWLP
jgi:hypothetical protein